MNKFWITGKNIAEVSEGIVWEFCGLFDSEEQAVAACSTVRHFVAPVAMNVALPDELDDFPACRYPLHEAAQ